MGTGVRVLSGPNSPGEPISRVLRNSWIQQVTGAGVLLCSWEHHVPGHSCQNPLTSATSDMPLCMCPGSCSQCYLVLLPGKNCPPPKRKPSSSGPLGPLSRGGGVGSLSQGRSQKVMTGRLWLLLPGVRKPTPFKVLWKKQFSLKFLNSVFPSPNDTLKEEQ